MALLEEDIFKRKTIALLFMSSILFPSCSSITNQPDIHDIAVQTAIKLAKPSLEKIFFAQSPILSASQDQFTLADRPPGGEFKAQTDKSIIYDSTGNLELFPGDYIIPVMTYCMKSNGSSPDGHPYTLSRLAGTMALVIREINLKALPKFSPRDVQILSWSIQNGLKYDEMTSESRRIVDDAIPDLKPQLKRSFFEKFAQEWNLVADKSHGLIPSFENVTDEFLEELGDVGTAIIQIRDFRRLIKTAGNDYSRLSQLIHLPGHSAETQGVSTAWSKISENIYARFITKGHFQEVGEFQVRILPATFARKVNSVNTASVKVDISSLVADPRSNSIQPLSFSPLYGYAGVLVAPELAANPILLGVLLGVVLASQPVDWNAFHDVGQLGKEMKNSSIRRLLDQGIITLHKAHDELEKPARDLGVIDRKTKKTNKNEKSLTREYEKSGGKKALEKDFDQFPGDATPSEPGVEVKILPNGSKVVKRPIVSENNKAPTLEIQPQKLGNKNDDGRRIKIRYPTE